MADPVSAAAAAFAQWVTAAFINTTGITSLAAAQAVYAVAYVAAYAGTTAAITVGLGAIARAQVPDPESQKITRKQPRPARYVAVGGPSRISGAYMHRETSGATLGVVLALCEGRLATISKVYLNDDEVTITGGWVQEGEGGRYGTGDRVKIATRLGLPTETHFSDMTSLFSTTWPITARGDGIASLMMLASHLSKETFSKFFPNGEPLPSVVGAPVCYDWRDGTQSRADSSTWKANANPIVWLVHLEWHRFGKSWDRCIEPVLADLTVEADYCDEAVATIGGTEPRYRCAGGFFSNTEPQAVREALLATCDGWLSTNGKGQLVLKAGRYVAPTFTLTGEHIVGYSWRAFQTSEEACNELIVSYVSPLHKYTEVECDPWRDEDDITSRGVVRSENLQLTWVSYHTQARRLAKRKMSRLSAPRRGQVRATIYGLNGLGERYIRVQNPELASMADVVVEVMNVEIDPSNAQVVFDVILADPAVDEWDPATEEGAAPPVEGSAPFVPGSLAEPNTISVTPGGPNVYLQARAPLDDRMAGGSIKIYARLASTTFDVSYLIATKSASSNAFVTHTHTPGSSGNWSYWFVAVGGGAETSDPAGPITVPV